MLTQLRQAWAAVPAVAARSLILSHHRYHARWDKSCIFSAGQSASTCVLCDVGRRYPPVKERYWSSCGSRELWTISRHRSSCSLQLCSQVHYLGNSLSAVSLVFVVFIPPLRSTTQCSVAKEGHFATNAIGGPSVGVVPIPRNRRTSLNRLPVYPLGSSVFNLRRPDVAAGTGGERCCVSVRFDPASEHVACNRGFVILVYLLYSGPIFSGSEWVEGSRRNGQHIMLSSFMIDPTGRLVCPMLTTV